MSSLCRRRAAVAGDRPRRPQQGRRGERAGRAEQGPLSARVVHTAPVVVTIAAGSVTRFGIAFPERKDSFSAGVFTEFPCRRQSRCRCCMTCQPLLLRNLAPWCCVLARNPARCTVLLSTLSRRPCALTCPLPCALPTLHALSRHRRLCASLTRRRVLQALTRATLCIAAQGSELITRLPALTVLEARGPPTGDETGREKRPAIPP